MKTKHEIDIITQFYALYSKYYATIISLKIFWNTAINLLEKYSNFFTSELISLFIIQLLKHYYDGKSIQLFDRSSLATEFMLNNLKHVTQF